ncbi:MAG: hypothetical protein M0R77_00220 [Gammaproteobacteria bacterium]|nr:hypothetical protein [Gammaproteobacteria bacterium]
MYIVEFTTRTIEIETTSVTVGSKRSLTNLIIILENSKSVLHWKINGHRPSDIGLSNDSFSKEKV